MVVIDEDTESNSSQTSNRGFSVTNSFSQSRVNYASPEEERIMVYCKQKLHKRLFIGHYQERRYVEKIAAYRDVVEIHKSESDFKKDLDTVKRQLEIFRSGLWIGITGPRLAGTPASHALWVKLQDLSFGYYWFQIKHIKVADREILVSLKVVRSLDTFPLEVNEPATQQKKSTSSTQPPPRPDSTPSSATAPENNDDKDWSDNLPTLEECAEAMQNWATFILQRGLQLSVTMITLHNITEVFRFMAAFLLATIAALVQSIRFTGDFSIKLMRETSIFVQASTPIILGLIDFCTKMVGGLYILLAMMWRGDKSAPRAQPQYQQQNYNRPALMMGPPPSSSRRSSNNNPYQ